MLRSVFHMSITKNNSDVKVTMILAGYRHIGLRSEFNQPQGVATLFVHIQVKDYIIDAFAGQFYLFYFVGFWLCQDIKYITQAWKRTTSDPSGLMSN